MKEECVSRTYLERAEKKGKVRMTKNTLVGGVLVDC